MRVVGIIAWDVLSIFLIFLMVRVVADVVQSFARGWTPRGPVLVGLEIVYTVTDPPLKLVRRLIPPLRFGGFGIDVAFLIVLVVVYVGRWAVSRVLL
ncbi:MAG TPA: YggT family protein [Actinopolymorphaceae bacterium]